MRSPLPRRVALLLALALLGLPQPGQGASNPEVGPVRDPAEHGLGGDSDRGRKRGIQRAE